MQSANPRSSIAELQGVSEQTHTFTLPYRLGSNGVDPPHPAASDAPAVTVTKYSSEPLLSTLTTKMDVAHATNISMKDGSVEPAERKMSVTASGIAEGDDELRDEVRDRRKSRALEELRDELDRHFVVLREEYERRTGHIWAALEPWRDDDDDGDEAWWRNDDVDEYSGDGGDDSDVDSGGNVGWHVGLNCHDKIGEISGRVVPIHLSKGC